MNIINQSYINALLADASYVSLPKGFVDIESANYKELEKRLTTPQATFIAENFEVLNSVETPQVLGSGFDAVVWRGKAGTNYAGKIYVSMRGTQSAQDIADDITLAGRGIPHQQIADVLNIRSVA